MANEPCKSILIAGGGFSGTTLAIHLARAVVTPIEITVVEPCVELGRGVAYSTRDIAHRVNVPTNLMALSVDDVDEATRWFAEQGLLNDPNSELNNGIAYVPRYQYGTFLSDRLAKSVAEAGDRVRFQHKKAMVKSIRRRDCRWLASLDDGSSVETDLVALCFGHSLPRVPFAVGDNVRKSPKFVENPWSNDALSALTPTDSVLVVGTGLTMVDVVLGLRATGHTGVITAASRHGLIPRPHGDFRDGDGFLDNMVLPTSALSLLRLARLRVKEVGREVGWQPIADAISAKLPAVWQSLQKSEKMRVIHRLLPFWEVHRFRIPPHSYEVLNREVANGSLEIVKSRVDEVVRSGCGFDATLNQSKQASIKRAFDAVVVCTGPDKNIMKNPLVAALIGEGVARTDDTNFGIEVDRCSRVIAEDGDVQSDMFAFGPMTRSSFGEMSGANDIAAQIERVTREVIGDTLGAKSRHHAGEPLDAHQ